MFSGCYVRLKCMIEIDSDELISEAKHMSLIRKISIPLTEDEEKQQLFKSWPNPNFLQYAILKNKPKALIAMLNAKEDNELDQEQKLELKLSLFQCQYSGSIIPLLHLAVKTDAKECLIALIRWIKDHYPEQQDKFLDMENPYGQTALHIAAEQANPDNQLEYFKLLADAGCQLDKKSKESEETPLLLLMLNNPEAWKTVMLEYIDVQRPEAMSFFDMKHKQSDNTYKDPNELLNDFLMLPEDKEQALRCVSEIRTKILSKIPSDAPTTCSKKDCNLPYFRSCRGKPYCQQHYEALKDK